MAQKKTHHHLSQDDKKEEKKEEVKKEEKVTKSKKVTKADRSNDKYAIIDDAIDAEMMDSGMNELKSSDYYEKQYDKVHES